MSDRRISKRKEFSREGQTLQIEMKWKPENLPSSEDQDKFLEEANKLSGEIDLRPGEHITFKRCGPFYLYCSYGPPTWYLPRVNITRTSIGIGWIRAYYEISYTPKNEVEK